uniref:ArnT family glycosyltransferase n=1 Tax=Mariniphaga sediminis TaxID=1628158 RepID=UPI003566E5B0
MNGRLKNSLWAVAFLMIILAWIFGLFIDLTGDSGLYAAISRQMVESGDWLNLKINGEPYDQKPHLFFWLAGLGIQLFGNTNFAFKLFPALWALTGVYFTYRLGKLLFSKKTGKLAALFLGTSQIFTLYLLDFHTDSVLHTGVTLALWQLAFYLKEKKTSSFIFGFIGIGLAMFTKGPIGAVIPFLMVLLYLLNKKEYYQLFHPKWILGIVISLAVISPALFHLFDNFGWDGIRFYFITNNFGRITGEYAGSSTDYLFYLHTFAWATLPWLVWVIFAHFSEIKSWFSKREKPDWGFYLLGSALIFTFILSIAKGKAPNYFLIVVPVISIITAKWMATFDTFSEKIRRNLIRGHQALLILLIFLFVFILFIFGVTHILITSTILLFLLIGLFYSKKKERNKFNRMILKSVFIFGSLHLFLNVEVLPKLFSYQGPRQALKHFMENRKPHEPLYNLHLEEYALFFYAPP